MIIALCFAQLSHRDAGVNVHLKKTIKCVPGYTYAAAMQSSPTPHAMNEEMNNTLPAPNAMHTMQ
jgi:hypothetical protein